jgi:hypothetical protein
MSGETFGWNVAMTGGGWGYWPYDQIRIVNVFINNFPNYKDKYDAATYNALMGEARFLRAFFYQGMAKRYGGVPIITEVQDPVTTPLEELQVPRNTEYDTWKFIYDVAFNALCGQGCKIYPIPGSKHRRCSSGRFCRYGSNKSR